MAYDYTVGFVRKYTNILEVKLKAPIPEAMNFDVLFIFSLYVNIRLMIKPMGIRKL
ncbi:hypothetical protein [Clostridium thermarum]|uniref:hypothetical protein n=1 Tax=Clostridium thermarum TaxID=1716543 RepID=UPI0015D66CC0|nr:hypothetical protein [Clostridium thermarum]